MESLERPRVDYLTPADLVRDVRSGLVRIPPFQRSYRWDAADVVLLFDSILRGFPIGNLLLWQRPAPAQRLTVGPLVVEAPATDSALWVVDGQQRITSLVGALTSASSATDPRFRVHLDLDAGRFHTAGARQEPPRHWIPVDQLLYGATLVPWMRANSWLTPAQLSLADAAAKAVREYQILAYTVRSDREDLLLEIFARVNTSGKRLTQSEVFQALHAGFTGDEPSGLPAVGQLSAQLGFGQFENRLALRCVLAARDGDIFQDDVSELTLLEDESVELFRSTAAALREVIAFLRGPAGIPHVRLLPYSHVVPLLVRFVVHHGQPSGRSATLLRRWVWRGAVAGTRARGTSVSDLRQQLRAAASGAPLEAARGMLAAVPSYPDFAPELDKVHFSHAMSKLNVLGLLSAEPRSLETGEILDIALLLSSGSPVRTIISSGGGELAATMANRAILPAGTAKARLEALTAAAEQVAMSHGIDPESQALLAAGEVDAFLARREARVSALVQDLVTRMAEWGARDGPSLADLLRTVA